MRMKTPIISIALVALLAAIVPAVADGIPKPTRPLVIVFDSTAGEGADKALAASTTKALCSYLRDSRRVEATVFDRESPTVLRAIMDKQLTADQVASYSSQPQRIGVAKALSYEYAAGAETSVKNGMVQVKVWMAKSSGGKKSHWEAVTQAVVGGGGGDRDFDNAMQSATSAAVISIVREAFASLPPIEENQPTTGEETAVIGADQIAPPAAPTAADYVTLGDASTTAGSLALAVQQYQQAVNADPTNPALRMKLANAFARKGMYDEAAAELDRATKMGASADQIAAAGKEIADLRAGKEPGRPEVIKTIKVAPEPTAAEPPESKPDPKTAVGKMREGDKLWQANKPDEAADAYNEAIRLNPADWRAYERLALVDASMSLFGESRKTLEQLAKVEPAPTPQVIANRHQLFSAVFEQWFTTLFRQYDRDLADYQRKSITRESYYSATKGLGGRLESMAKFLDALPVPADKKPASLHRSLACGLVSQAASSLLDYLETNNSDSKSNAETFVTQAKKELEIAKKLESSAVSAGKQPATASPDSGVDEQPAEQPSEQPTESAPPSDNSGQWWSP